MSIKTTIQANYAKNPDFGLLFHFVPYTDNAHHYTAVTSYVSDDHIVIGKKLDLIQKEDGDGILITTEGPIVGGVQWNATMIAARECEERGLKVGLVLDPWIAKGGPSDPTSDTIQMLNHPDTATILNSPAYLPEKYILDFGVGLPTTAVDYGKVVSAMTCKGFTVLKRHKDYSWPEVEIYDDKMKANRDRTTDECIAQYAADHASPTMKIPGLARKFWDGGFPKKDGTLDQTLSSWGDGGPSRFLSAQAGMLFFRALDTLSGVYPYIALATLDDEHEDTELLSWMAIQHNVRLG